tara:strand:- start:59541 stop:62345 length:2805 start_codon:yes stop_codon:yes gene_type:complete
MRKGILVLALLALGCNNQGQDIYTMHDGVSGVEFVFPGNRQLDVPVGSPIYVSLVSPTNEQALDGLEIRSHAGELLPGTATLSENKRIIRFEHDGMKPGTGYTIYLNNGIAQEYTGPIASFQTRRSDLVAEGGFKVESMVPDPMLPFLDFSTVRILLTEEVLGDTAITGNSFQLRGPDGAQVPGRLLVHGRHITFDPDVDLVPDARYTLRLTADIQSRSGSDLNAFETTLVPQPSSPRGQIKVNLASTPDEQSILTGNNTNRLNMQSALLGKSVLNPAGEMKAEVADAQKHQDILPMVVRRDSQLHSQSLEIRLGGEIPSGLETGDIQITMASDMNGYILANPFDQESGKAAVYLVMDVYMNCENGLPNVLMNQQIQQVQAVGTVEVKGNSMILNVIGTLELGLMGIDSGTIEMVLQMGTPEDGSMTGQNPDPPELTGSYPQDNSTSFHRGEGLVLTFSQPLSQKNLKDHISFYDRTDASYVDFQAELKGSSLFLKPDHLLKYGHDYRVTVQSTLEDSQGNHPVASSEIDFQVPEYNDSGSFPPRITAMYPGTQCSLVGGDFLSGGNVAGRCAGGKGSDDVFSVFTLPANRNVEIYFSQPLDPATITLGSSCNSGSVRIVRVDASGNCLSPVPGKLEKKDRKLVFVPEHPWVVGQRYHVQLVSGSNDECQTGDICNTEGIPLDPDPLNGAQGGGPDFIMPFDGVAATTQPMTPLHAVPATDFNGNSHVQSDEVRYDQNRVRLKPTDHSGIVSDVSISGEDRMFLNGLVMISIGNYDATHNRIPVTVHPQQLFGTSQTMDVLALILPLEIDTETMIMRYRGVNTGYITPDGHGGAEFTIELPLYLDAPDMEILGGTADTDLHSKEINMELNGPVVFYPDGRWGVELENTSDIDIDVGVSLLSIGAGGMTLTIEKGELKLPLISEPGKKILHDLRL